MIIAYSDSFNEQKTAKTSKGFLLNFGNWQTQMSYKSESASISATFRILIVPEPHHFEDFRHQLVFQKGCRFKENRLFALSTKEQKIPLLTHILKLALPCKKSIYFFVLCPLIIGLDKTWNMEKIIYLCGTYFELAKEGEAQKTECENVVFLYQAKMLQKHCVLQLQFFPEDGPHLVDQAEVWQDALILVYFCT